MLSAAAIEKYVRTNFPQFGVNKAQQVIRLIFEIAKREKASFGRIFDQLPPGNLKFDALKRYLLARRYPNIENKDRLTKAHLPKLDLQAGYCQRTTNHFKINPKEILVEQAVAGSPLARRIRELFPGAKVKIIAKYRDYVNQNKFTVADYNRRMEKFFIIKEDFEHILECPCTKEAVGCGYVLMNLAFGCGFECSYCFLQSYTNSPGITFAANIDDFFKKVAEAKRPLRIGTGQFTDSLIFDHLTGYSTEIIEFFRKHPQHTFEFKTKSDNIKLLLEAKPSSNIIVSWSVNPKKMIDENEFYSASLAARLEGAEACAKHGYTIGFHFDPIIYYAGWEKDYRSVVEKIFASIDEEKIAWISLGTLRMTPQQKQVIENRFPGNKILDAEMILGFDQKLRYSFDLRKEIYQRMQGWIKNRNTKAKVYLCMEEKKMHEAVKMPAVF